MRYTLDADAGRAESRERGCRVNDYDKLKELLTSFGVEFTEETKDDVRIIECYEGHAKVTGHPYFFTDFNFDKDGKFIEMGVWE